ncbi:hypothetical protein BDR03DRAFT_1011090 [Suillus americanus]|nr:hypothetical protein BDR03DRAFT_1011090 [Suillus americanus]
MSNSVSFGIKLSNASLLHQGMARSELLNNITRLNYLDLHTHANNFVEITMTAGFKFIKCPGMSNPTPTFTTALNISELIKNVDEKQVVKAIYSIFLESFVRMVHQRRFKWERFEDWCDSITSDGLSTCLSTMSFASTTRSSLHSLSDDIDDIDNNNNTAELTLLSKPVECDARNNRILNPVKSEVRIPSPAPLTGPTPCKYPLKSKAPSPFPFPCLPPLKYPASLHTPLAPISPTPSSQQGKITSRLPSPPPFVISPHLPPLKYPASSHTLLAPISPTASFQQGKILSKLPSPPPFIISPNLPPLKYSVSLHPPPSPQRPSPSKKKTSSGRSIMEFKAVSVPSHCDFQLSPSTPRGVNSSLDPWLPSSNSVSHARLFLCYTN